MSRLELWPMARDNMTAQERGEVSAWHRAHPEVPVRIGYSVQARRFYAMVGDRREESRFPMEAFRAAIAPQIVSVLRD